MKNPVNKNLTINRYGQLIRWKDGPEIINGVSRPYYFTIGSAVSIPYLQFTIAKNELKGL